MLARIGSNLSLVIATLLFASSTLSTIGVAGPVAVPACAGTCCVNNAEACSTATGCTGCTGYICASGGGFEQCNK